MIENNQDSVSNSSITRKQGTGSLLLVADGIAAYRNSRNNGTHDYYSHRCSDNGNTCMPVHVYPWKQPCQCVHECMNESMQPFLMSPVKGRRAIIHARCDLKGISGFPTRRKHLVSLQHVR